MCISSDLFIKGVFVSGSSRPFAAISASGSSRRWSNAWEHHTSTAVALALAQRAVYRHSGVSEGKVFSDHGFDDANKL